MKRQTIMIAGAVMLLAIPVTATSATPDRADQNFVSIEVAAGESEVTYIYDIGAEAPIVTLERWPGELRSDVPAETIELFADGLLRVTYPEFRIFEGVYELQLTHEQAQTLLKDVAETGIVETDGRNWKQVAAKKENEQFEESRRRGIHEIVGYQTSDTLTVIQTRFAKVDDQPGTQTHQEQQEAVARTFRYYGLATDAGRHRELDHLAAAATVEKRLLDLADQARARSAED